MKTLSEIDSLAQKDGQMDGFQQQIGFVENGFIEDGQSGTNFQSGGANCQRGTNPSTTPDQPTDSLSRFRRFQPYHRHGTVDRRRPVAGAGIGRIFGYWIFRVG